MVDGKILIVDDTVENLEGVSQVLKDAGYEISTALNGNRALKLASHHRPDLILLDVQMPGIDGFETGQKLKENSETSGIAVIFMTVYNDTNNIIKAFELGAVDYITKPFHEKELLARVRTHLQLHQWNKTLEKKVEERTHKLQTALDQINQFQLQLLQSEKMSALGNLLSGVAHEINNPIGFVQGNLKHAEDYTKDLLNLIKLYQEKYPEPDAEITQEINAIDFDYIRDDFPKLIASMIIGMERICQISTSLRIFSRTDRECKVSFNVHDGIDSTLLLLQHRMKKTSKDPGIQITKNYGDIPLVQCFTGQLNQVFMNVFANAIDSFDEVSCNQMTTELKEDKNRITINTAIVNENQVEIKIEDNGCGMKPETKNRIFEQGFTTKAVGKGTGLGMAIAHQIITEKHGGTITCDSQVGKGTIFTIRLPIL